MFSWMYTSDMTEEDKEHFLDRWRASSTVRERILEIFRNRKEALYKDEEDVDNINSPNWVAQQAFNLGKRKAYREIEQILDQEE